jgi:hypothetical protein
LRRVGCNTGAVDGNWNAASQRSLDLFNKHSGMKLDVKNASADALDAVKGKTSRVCPLVCDHGFKASGDACVKIACRAGYIINDGNECERVHDKKPVATREDTKKRDTERKQIDAAPVKPSASGQILCNHAGCRPVSPGCRVANRPYTSGGQIAPGGGQIEVCN